jgi:hypothetical protein
LFFFKSALQAVAEAGAILEPASPPALFVRPEPVLLDPVDDVLPILNAGRAF